MSEPHKVSTPDDTASYYRRLQMAEGQLHELKEAVKAWAAVAIIPIDESVGPVNIEKYMAATDKMRKLAGCSINGEQSAQSGPALMRVYPPKEEDEPVFREWEVVTGDINCRSDPGSRMRLNTSMAWIVGPAHRSQMKAREELKMILEMLDERNKD